MSHMGQVHNKEEALTTRESLTIWMNDYVSNYDIYLLVLEMRHKHNIPKIAGYIYDRDTRARLEIFDMQPQNYPLPTDWISGCKVVDETIIVADLIKECTNQLLRDGMPNTYCAFLLLTYIFYGEIYEGESILYDPNDILNIFDFSNFKWFIEKLASQSHNSNGGVFFSEGAWDELMSVVEPLARSTPKAICFNPGVSARMIKRFIDERRELTNLTGKAAYRNALHAPSAVKKSGYKAKALALQFHRSGMKNEDIKDALKARGLHYQIQEINTILSRKRKAMRRK